MANPDLTRQHRIIFFHKHGTSARTRFLRFADDTVCGFAPLPKLVQLIDKADKLTQPPVETHPAVLLKQGAERLQLPASALELEGDYTLWVDVPGGAIRVLLVRYHRYRPAVCRRRGARRPLYRSHRGTGPPRGGAVAATQGL